MWARAGKARTAPCGCPVQRAGLPRPPSGRGSRRHFPDLGARVLKHGETLGLGDKIDLAKSAWMLSFNGLSLATLPAAKWAVKKDGGVFGQMAGAAITPRVVELGVIPSYGGFLLMILPPGHQRARDLLSVLLVVSLSASRAGPSPPLPRA